MDLDQAAAKDVHVHGAREAAVKVRIDKRSGSGSTTEYGAHLDPANQETNLADGTVDVTFGPEHVATVFVKKPGG